MNSGQIVRLLEDLARMDWLQEQSAGLLDFRVNDRKLPVEYQIKMRCKGLCIDHGLLREINEHRVTIVLGPNYPDIGPTLLWETPIFHPNIRRPAVCLVDRTWAKGTHLDDICLWLWDMARYRLYNVDPNDSLDKAAARWAKQHEMDFPKDPTDLSALVLVAAQSSDSVLRGDKELMDAIKVFD